MTSYSTMMCPLRMWQHIHTYIIDYQIINECSTRRCSHNLQYTGNKNSALYVPDVSRQNLLSLIMVCTCINLLLLHFVSRQNILSLIMFCTCIKLLLLHFFFSRTYKYYFVVLVNMRNVKISSVICAFF